MPLKWTKSIPASLARSVKISEFDEATPSTIQPFADAIPDVRWHIFEESSHVPHIEEREAYMELVQSFLADHDTPQ